MEILIVENNSNVTRKLFEKFSTLESKIDFQKCAPESKQISKFRQFNKYDVVLIDWGIQIEAAMSIIDKIRKISDVPILMISQDYNSSKVVKVLDKGADDALGSPFSLDELDARIKNLAQRPRALLFKETKINFKSLEIDLKNHQVKVENRPVGLTKTEYKILTYMTLNRNRVFKPQELIEHLFNKKNNKCQHLLNMHIFNLKKKLQDNFPITTVPNVGFIIRA